MRTDWGSNPDRCKRGHRLIERNVFYRRDGYMACRQCLAQHAKDRHTTRVREREDRMYEIFRAWVSECLMAGVGLRGGVMSWMMYAERHGVKGTSKGFHRMMRRCGFKRTKSHGVRVYKGLSLGVDDV